MANESGAVAGFVAIAIHHVASEHTEDMLTFMRRVVAATEGAPGLIGFDVCRDVSRGVLAGYSRWTSRADFEAGLERIMSLRAERRPEWTTQPDDVLMPRLLDHPGTRSHRVDAKSVRGGSTRSFGVRARSPTRAWGTRAALKPPRPRTTGRQPELKTVCRYTEGHGFEFGRKPAC